MARPAHPGTTGLLWQYGLWSFQTGGTKLERFLPKNQHTQRKFLNFENWTNGEPQYLAKIRRFKVDRQFLTYRNVIYLKRSLIKIVIYI
jgi:hypothetical protein